MRGNRKSPLPALPPFLARIIYTGLGLGLSPKAPGTVGTLLGIPIFWLCQDFSWWLYAVITIIISLLGWWAAQQAEEDYGQHDAPQVVIDEVAGYMVTMFLAPALPFIWLWGFLAFRLFDIWKPGIIGKIDRQVPGAGGVMLDDIAAGLYAWALLQIIGFIFA